MNLVSGETMSQLPKKILIFLVTTMTLFFSENIRITKEFCRAYLKITTVDSLIHIYHL